MTKTLPAVATRPEQAPARELPLRPLQESPRPTPLPQRRPADRIKEALIRWLEGEM